MTDRAYGFIGTPSTSSNVAVYTFEDELSTPIVGQTIFFDQLLNNGKTYRCMGYVNDVTTENASFNDPTVLSVVASNIAHLPSKDIKKLNLRMQAVYSSETGLPGSWSQAGSATPSSPASGINVSIMDEVTMHNILGERLHDASYVGTFQGMPDVKMPMNIKGFDDRRGATHKAIIGRSGSGKTGLAHTLTFVQMRNESHAVVVIDPQGQWSSESGFLFSLQEAARALGREVHVLRVSEDIRLPLDRDLLSGMLDEMHIWTHFTRMGDDNARAFSVEVARKVISNIYANQSWDIDARAELMSAFKGIAESKASMGRIYARSGEAGFNLQSILCAITGAPLFNKKEEEVEITDEDIADGEESFEAVLKVFTPIMNLFSSKNLSGSVRQSLDGEHGFLAKVLKSRSHGEVAPYVILDMSSDTTLSGRAAYAQSAGQEDSMLSMRKILDNSEVKAHIINTVITSVRDRAEQAYSDSHAMLDTQIIFDEAWRYAPNTSSVERNSAVAKISKKLADYARDTRKYGLGWTYILQSPRDLNENILKQITFTYAGHGMIGSDRNMLADMTDDSSSLKLYDQFSDPGATGIYPFMGLGPISPLIFTASPVFFNVFTSVDDLLTANAFWIKEICELRGLPDFSRNPDRIRLGRKRSTPVTTPSQPSRRQGSQRGVGSSGVPARVDDSDVSAPPF